MRENPITEFNSVKKAPEIHKGRVHSSLFEGSTEELYQAYMNYRFLFEFGKLVTSETQIDRIIDVLLDKLLELISAERCLILLFNQQGQSLYEVGRNLNHEEIAEPQFEVSWSIINKVKDQRTALCIKNALENLEFQKSKSVFQLKILSVICVPIILHETMIGVLYADNRKIMGNFEESACVVSHQFVQLVAGPLASALHRKELENHNTDLQIHVQSRTKYHSIIGTSPVIQQVLHFIDQVADTNATVLIEGESGTGKELVARALHENSCRRNEPFISLNCGALTETLLESELFGHVKGAFTGASSNKKGWFETAHGGTIFFDEISEMSPALQVKLLRILQTGEFAPVGSREILTCDVRIIAATNVHLQDLVAKGKFRSDLYYRLNILYVHLPPLQERGLDILLLADYFLKYYGERHGKPSLTLSSAVQDILLYYSYPGNVRELENAIQHAVVMAEYDEIMPVNLPVSFHTIFVTKAVLNKNFSQAKRRIVDQFEKEYIRHALQVTKGVVVQAAKLAGMDAKNFHQKMSKYGLVAVDFKQP